MSTSRASHFWVPAAGGSEIGRYEPIPDGLFVYYKPELLDAPRNREIFVSEGKIVVQEIRNITLLRRIIATYDDQKTFCLQSTNVINVRPTHSREWPLKYLLGVLNSSAVNFFFRNRFSGNNHIASNQLAQIPVPRPESITKANVAAVVGRLLKLHCSLASTKSSHARALVQRQIDATDCQIDQLVYELYGLTKEEIALIEGTAAAQHA